MICLAGVSSRAGFHSEFVSRGTKATIAELKGEATT